MLRGGLILTYTNADTPIQLNGYTYLANSILLSGLKFKSSAGLVKMRSGQIQKNALALNFAAVENTAPQRLKEGHTPNRIGVGMIASRRS